MKDADPFSLRGKKEGIIFVVYKAIPAMDDPAGKFFLSKG